MDKLREMVLNAFRIFLVLAFTGSLQAAEGVLGIFKENFISSNVKDGKVKGKVNLLEIGSLEELKAQPKLLESILEAIDFEEMPPEDEPQLKPEARKKFLGDLEDLLHQSVAGKKEYLQSPIRRMNRFQYNNAVTDLFGLKCNVFTLPERMMRDHKGYFKPETGKMADRVTVGSRPLGKSQMIEPRLAGVAAFPQDLRAEVMIIKRITFRSLRS